jgi:hypothetical protein
MLGRSAPSPRVIEWRLRLRLSCSLRALRRRRSSRLAGITLDDTRRDGAVALLLLLGLLLVAHKGTLLFNIGLFRKH